MGVKIIVDSKKRRVLQIYHVEVGQLGGYKSNVVMLKEKFSNTRTDEIEKRYKERMAFAGDVQYDKLYISIWDRPRRVERLMNDSEIAEKKIEVWTSSKFFSEVFKAIRDWDKTTLPEGYWLLKLLESLWEVRNQVFVFDSTTGWLDVRESKDFNHLKLSQLKITSDVHPNKED